MKIPNIENGKNVIYVQLRDIYAVIELCDKIPVITDKEIKDKVITDQKENEFIKLEQQESIDFFNSLNWILDFKRFASGDFVNIEFGYYKAQQALNLRKLILAEVPNEESIKLEYKKAKHKMDDINQAVQSMAFNKIDIPLIADSSKPALKLKKDSKYTIQKSLNPHFFLIKADNNSSISVAELEEKDIINAINLSENYEDQISVSFYEMDDTTIACKVNIIKKEIVKRKKERNFFKRKKQKQTTNKGAQE